MSKTTWSISDAAEIMGIEKVYLKELVNKGILTSINGKITKDSVDKYFSHALFTFKEAAKAVGIPIKMMNDCIETLTKHGLPIYKAWGKDHIREEDLDKIDGLIDSFFNPNKEKNRQKLLSREVNDKYKSITNKQGNKCFVCNETFKSVPEYWLNRMVKGVLELHAICKTCSVQQKCNN